MTLSENGKRRGGKPGNLNALKHGLYSRFFQAQEIRDLQKGETHASALNDEVTVLRVLIHRMLASWDSLNDPHDQVRVMNAISLTSTRLGALLKMQSQLAEGESEEQKLLQAAIGRLTEKWKLGE